MFIDKAFKTGPDFEMYFFFNDLKIILEISKDAEELAKVKAKEASDYFTEVINGKIDKTEDLKAASENAYRSLIKYTLHFNYIVFHSLFVSAFSIFEVFLTNIAKSLENGSNLPIKMADIASKKGGELDKVRKYLNLVLTLKTADPNNETWQTITYYYQVRNMIVHNANSLKKRGSIDSHIKEFLIKMKVNVDKKETFRITTRDFLSGFILSAAEYTKALLTEIYDPKSPTKKMIEGQRPISLDKAFEFL